MTDHTSLAEALAAFQAELPSVHKGAKGQVPGKRDHRYADLADLSATVLPLLGRHGLSWTTRPTLDDVGRLVLRYELLHTSGESRTGDYPLAGSTAWEVGSSLTYARRYCLSAVTGVAADDDDDGHAAQHAPPARPARTATQARTDLTAVIKTNDWDEATVKRLFAGHYPTGLDAETDAGRIDKFRQWLFSQPQEALVATESAQANGAAS